MNKVLMPLLFGAFILTGPSFAQTTPPPAAPAEADVASVAVKPVVHREHRMERHPELHKVMRKLRGAKADLEKAAHDYGGHRVKAISAINAALEELKAALESDKK